MRRTDIIGVLPPEADLQVMSIVDKIQEPLKQLLALFVSKAVDVLNVATDREDALPSSDGVGSNNGVNGLELSAYVLRCTTRLVIQLEAGSLSNLTESRLLKSSSQRLEEFLVRLADAVIDFITRGPECICHTFRNWIMKNDRNNGSFSLTSSSLGQLDESKRSVISRNRLKGDITVPASSLLPLGAELIRLGLLVVLVKLNRADGANLRITATEFSLIVQERVDMQARCSGSSSQFSKSENELFLEVVGEVILGTEENDTTL